jgi:signal transduction histidine kinase
MAAAAAVTALDPHVSAAAAAGTAQGLGLSTSRMIVEAHGGTLAIRGRPGEKTTLTVQLPATMGRAAQA